MYSSRQIGLTTGAIISRRLGAWLSLRRTSLILENANSHHFDMHGARDYEKYNQMAVYRLDESSGLNADDAATFTDHDCTLTNLTDDAWVDGYVGNAIRFGPFEDHGSTVHTYLQCEVGEHLESEEGSISFFFKPDELPHRHMDLLHMGNSNNNASWYGTTSNPHAR